MWFFKKTNLRRTKLRQGKTLSSIPFKDRSGEKTGIPESILFLIVFVVACATILSYELFQSASYSEVIPLTITVTLISLGIGFYIYFYQKRIIKNHVRALILGGLFVVLLFITKLGILLFKHTAWGTGTAVTIAIILTIAYDQRFAMGMCVFYCLIASFVSPQSLNINTFITMSAGAVTCCFCIKEIRTRMKLLEVSSIAAGVVLIISTMLGIMTMAEDTKIGKVFSVAGYHALATFFSGLLIQGLLPLIEKIFRIATSMTLLDYSDANQPLLRRLAMEAPGTYSHSLLVGSIAEAAAESIGRNGLLCRVGAYYHDIGKINKPTYFVENEMGSSSRHKELSPAMSQLIIVGHVKDGIEMAKEYGLPRVLHQFIEAHHGTTLVEYFYSEAKRRQEEQQSESVDPNGTNSGSKPLKKKKGDKAAPVSESEFRYQGPKPRTKEAAIVMLSDTVEGAVRSLSDATPMKIKSVVHNMSMKRLQDGQFDECDISLRELSQIEESIAKTLAAHHHGRIAYPEPPDQPQETAESKPEVLEQKIQ
jgi:putative nucleotidyltransferase with HDIG domain